MKKLYFIFLVLISSLAQAQVRVFDLDSVDTISTSDKEVKVEDLRDGFETINGVSVIENTVFIAPQTKATINLRDSFNGSSKINVRAAIKIGGGDGGGG